MVYLHLLSVYLLLYSSNSILLICLLWKQNLIMSTFKMNCLSIYLRCEHWFSCTIIYHLAMTFPVFFFLLLLFPFLSLLPYCKGLTLAIVPITLSSYQCIPCNFHLHIVSSNSTSLTWIFFFSHPYCLACVFFSAYVTIQSLFIISKNLFYADPVTLSVSLSFLTLIIVFSLL